MVVKKETERADVYTKEQYLTSRSYQDKRDAVNVVLDDKKSYTREDADRLIEKFMKGRVI